MLDDLKSFFTNSSVAEVGVGVTIGAAFAGVVGAATDAVRSLVSGDPEVGGLVTALVVLLSVAALSVFGVVRPLLRLKERMGSIQAAKVAEAVGQARSGDLSGAAQSARAAGVPLPGAGSDDDADGAAADAPSDEPGAMADGTQARALDAGGTPVEAEGAAVEPGPDGPTVHEGGTPDLPADGTDQALTGQPGADWAGLAAEQPGATAEEATTAGADGGEPSTPDPSLVSATAAPAAWDPLTGPLDGAPAADGTGAAAGTAAAAGAATAVGAAAAAGTGAASGTAAASGPDDADGAPDAAQTRVPFAATAEVKACPYCAFEIPAVATRCGWCTSDLADVQRAADPVLVDG